MILISSLIAGILGIVLLRFTSKAK
jgi:hypothetical protein